jgi:hypothetical protein
VAIRLPTLSASLGKSNVLLTKIVSMFLYSYIGQDLILGFEAAGCPPLSLEMTKAETPLIVKCIVESIGQ